MTIRSFFVDAVSEDFLRIRFSVAIMAEETGLRSMVKLDLRGSSERKLRTGCTGEHGLKCA